MTDGQVGGQQCLPEQHCLVSLNLLHFCSNIFFLIRDACFLANLPRFRVHSFHSNSFFFHFMNSTPFLFRFTLPVKAFLHIELNDFSLSHSFDQQILTGNLPGTGSSPRAVRSGWILAWLPLFSTHSKNFSQSIALFTSYKFQHAAFFVIHS